MNNLHKLLPLLLYLLSFLANSQDVQTLISEDFTIRDFVISKDSIFYIKKRDFYSHNKKNKESKHFFLGGYGLKFHLQKEDNVILTTSNELVDLKSSLRIYDKSLEKYTGEFFYKKGRIVDFHCIPYYKLAVISTTDKKILFINYQNPNKLSKVIEIDLSHMSRRIMHKDKQLYYSTDKGEIYTYDFLKFQKELIHQGKGKITDFLFHDDDLIYSNIEGQLVRVNLKSQIERVLTFEDNFITVLESYGNKLVCGGWNGTLYVVGLKNFNIEAQLNYHKRAVIALKTGANNLMYSSGVDRTIKQWKIK